MNSVLQDAPTLSDFRRSTASYGPSSSRYATEPFTEQDRNKLDAPDLFPYRNRGYAGTDSFGLPVGDGVFQQVLPKVPRNWGEAQNGPFGSSSCLGKRIPPRENPAPSRARTLESLLAPATQLEKRGHIDAALDVLYDRVDGLLRTKEFGVLDTILAQADVGRLSTDIIIGLLTATLPAKSKLPSRSNLFGDAEASIRSRGDWEAGLLAGLEP